MGSKRRGEPDGNAMAAAIAVQRAMIKFAEQFYRAEDLFDHLFEDGVQVTGIRIKLPDQEREGYMAVVSALVDGEPVVAFTGGSTYQEAQLGALQRLENRSLKWSSDRFKK